MTITGNSDGLTKESTGHAILDYSDLDNIVFILYTVAAEGLCIDEGFEYGALPDGWMTEGEGNAWTVGTGDNSSSTGAHNGNNNAKVTHKKSGQEIWLITPEQDLSGKSTAPLSFWYINRSWAGDIDELGVYYRIGSDGLWTELFYTSESHGTWTEWVGELPPEALTAGIQIGFKMTDHYGYGVGLDDVKLGSPGHSWSYVASENVITATCQNEDCVFGESRSFELTLNAEDGETAAVTLDGLESFNDATWLAVSEDDIVYYDGEIELLAPPVDAGEYTAKLTVEGVTAEKTFHMQLTPPVTNVTGLTLDPTEITLSEGDTASLTATVTPAEADQTVTWASDNTEVATVDENGQVTAVAKGTPTVTATAINGTPEDTSDDMTATCIVTVEHRHRDFSERKWAWTYIDGKCTVTSTYDCSCGQHQVLEGVVDEGVRNEADKTITYTATDDRGNTSTRTYNLEYTVTYSDEPVKRYAYGATCKLTATDRSNWFVKSADSSEEGPGEQRASGTDTFYFPVTEDVVVTATPSDVEEPQALKGKNPDGDLTHPIMEYFKYCF